MWRGPFRREDLMASSASPAPCRALAVSDSVPLEGAQPAADGGLESVVAERMSALLARLGDAVPALHEAVMSKAERGLFKAVLSHTKNHLGRASKILGLDRNTCARKARAFGLVDEPSRGRKPVRASGPKRKDSGKPAPRARHNLRKKSRTSKV